MNTPWSDREWLRVLVYGLGVSGAAVARFLLRRGVQVLAVDDREPTELELGAWTEGESVEIAASEALDRLPDDVDGVIVSPGVPGERPLLVEAERRGVPVIGEIELAFPFVEAPIVAITGSNGKSTTTAMTGAMIDGAGRRAVVCGNFGRPLIDCVGEEGDVLVTEVSSFQLESVDTFRPRAAALLNLSPDHLDRHGDLRRYGETKSRIFARQTADDVAVLNADDPLVARFTPEGLAAHRRYFSRREVVADGCYLDGCDVIEVVPGEEPQSLFTLGDVPIPGTHNLENAMASALLARAVGVAPEAVRPGLVGFTGLPHRLERIVVRGGVVWYDDSKGTNVGATAKSLEGFEDGSVHLILGGRGKGTSVDELEGWVVRKVRRLYLIGESAAEFERELGHRVPSERAGDLETAVAAAARHARSGEVVLLSPACASFDQYENYIARGEHFQRLVRGLAEVNDG